MELDDTWLGCSLGRPLPKLFKEFWYLKKNGRQGLYRKLWKSSPPKLLSDFKIISQEWSLGRPIPKLFKELYLKNHGRQGWGQSFLYSYIGNFENLLLQNIFTEMILRWTIVSNSYDNISKHMAPGAWSVFLIHLHLITLLTRLLYFSQFLKYLKWYFF